MSDDAVYRPIACSLHDRLETACLRRQPIAITWCNPDGHDHTATVIPSDVRSRAGAEYLVVAHDGEQLEIRLDRLLRFDDLPISGAAACE
jgi:transcriptional antiterminator Rof (Rho-off)